MEIKRIDYDFSVCKVEDFSIVDPAQHDIGIFAVSTYNTDYILVKRENYEKALQVFFKAGYQIV